MSLSIKHSHRHRHARLSASCTRCTCVRCCKLCIIRCCSTWQWQQQFFFVFCSIMLMRNTVIKGSPYGIIACYANFAVDFHFRSQKHLLMNIAYICIRTFIIFLDKSHYKCIVMQSVGAKESDLSEIMINGFTYFLIRMDWCGTLRIATVVWATTGKALILQSNGSVFILSVVERTTHVTILIASRSHISNDDMPWPPNIQFI